MEVSVVIPNFNGIAFLDSVLASLEGQTLSNFEVILVDNGSSCRRISDSAERSMQVYVRQKHRMFCF